MSFPTRPRSGAAGLRPANEGVIRLSGIDFRSAAVNCVSCGWTGIAAELKNPDLDSLQGDVTYACPECSRLVAVHAGLTDGEVLAEMRRISQLLAAEVNPVPLQTDTACVEGGASRTLDFHRVRERFPHQPGRDRAADFLSVESPTPAEPQNAELAFADIRARLTAG